MLLHQPYDSEASKDPQDVRQQAWPAGDRIAVIAGATYHATDTFLFDKDGKIAKQNVVIMKPAAEAGE